MECPGDSQMLHCRGLPDPDKSNGYEAIASIYIAGRGSDHLGVGASITAEWSKMLPAGATILDLRCGTGIPITHALVGRGFAVYGVDASAGMVDAFRARFPAVPVECASAEDSNFFGREFDGVVAWGLLFLLDQPTQRALISKIGGVLVSGGRFLFTAPRESCSWPDAITRRRSVSLGYEAYCDALNGSGMNLVSTYRDEGGNHYYSAQKR